MEVLQPTRFIILKPARCVKSRLVNKALKNIPMGGKQLPVNMDLTGVHGEKINFSSDKSRIFSSKFKGYSQFNVATVDSFEKSNVATGLSFCVSNSFPKEVLSAKFYKVSHQSSPVGDVSVPLEEIKLDRKASVKILNDLLGRLLSPQK